MMCSATFVRSLLAVLLQRSSRRLLAHRKDGRAEARPYKTVWRRPRCGRRKPIYTGESGGPRNSTPQGFPNAFSSSRLGFDEKTSLKPRKNA